MQREQINAPMPSMFSRFDMVCLASIALGIVAVILDPAGVIAGSVLLFAGILHAIRLVRWRGVHSWREPIVIMLHLGYFWVPAGLVLLGVAILWPDVMSSRDALHALTGGGDGLHGSGHCRTGRTWPYRAGIARRLGLEQCVWAYLGFDRIARHGRFRRIGLCHHSGDCDPDVDWRVAGVLDGLCAGVAGTKPKENARHSGAVKQGDLAKVKQ